MAMRIVIIGAGPAGITVAETLRKYEKGNFQIPVQSKIHTPAPSIYTRGMEEVFEIVLISAEPSPPYSPPAMLQYFMTGEEAHLWRWRDAPKQLNLEFRPGTIVTSVIPKEHKIKFKDNSSLYYDKLVIATGSHLFAPIPEIDKQGIYNFKSLSMANRLIKEVKEGRAKKAIIIGAGFIGVEIAILLNALGLEVIILEMQGQVMPYMLDGEIAKITLDLLSKRGIEVRLNTRVIEFFGDSRADGVTLSSKKRINSDIMIAATGVKPNIDFLATSGINTDWGIIIDKYMQTNIPDIYAAGDVAVSENRITHDRSVYPIFPNAVAQGCIAAYNLLGHETPFEGSDSMNSLKHLGLPIIAAGQNKGTELRLKKADTLKKIFIKDNLIVGFQLAGDIKGAGIYRTLMNKKIDIGQYTDMLLAQGFGMGYIFSKELYHLDQIGIPKI